MTPKALQSPPEVVKFNPTNYGLPGKESIKESLSRHDAPENKKKSTQGKEFLQRRQQCQDERGISEIYEKLQTIEELNESALDGRARRKLYHLKLIALGAKAPKPLQTPFRILKGMQRKQKERALKAKMTAREEGFIATSSQKKLKYN